MYRRGATPAVARTHVRTADAFDKQEVTMMSRRLTVLSIGAVAVMAAAPTVRAASFERFHGDSAHVDRGGHSAAVNACPAGGFLTVGSIDTSAFAIHAVRTGADGAVLWDKALAFGSGGFASAAVEARDGSGFVIAGSAPNDPANPAEVGAFLMKVDCSGRPVWARTYPGPSGFLTIVNQVIETANGDLVAVGIRQDQESGTVDGILFRTSANGALRWARRYDGGTSRTSTGLRRRGRSSLGIGTSSSSGPARPAPSWRGRSRSA
jgi:hypothetical protein